MSLSKMKPARQLIAITPSDSTSYASNPLVGLWFNVGGTVYVDAADLGTNVQIIAPAGVVFPAEITKVYATGLSGAVMVGMR